MRLKMMVSAAGDRWMARFPNAEHGPDEWADANGHVDGAKVREFLAAGSPEFIQFSDKDDKGVMFACYEFLWQLSCCVRHLEATHDHDCTTTAETRRDRSLERKMDAERFGFCRMDFDRFGGVVRVRIGYGNPKGVVGTVASSARTFAVDATRIMMHIAREVEKNTGGKARIIVEDAAGIEGLVADALAKDRAQEADDARKALIEGRAACPNRTAGNYCSPIRPDCPYGCYCGGRCEEVK